MDDSQSPPRLSQNEPGWADWRWLALLVVLVVPLRAWLLWNTEVMARDSVGFIRYALNFDEQSWGTVLRSFDQHPGYPAAIWLVSAPVRAWAGGVTPESMQLSAQLVSALAAVLLLVPMFYLGKAMWDARVGFGGALLFQYLPLSGHHLSDGMSESLFVLWISCGLLCAVRAVQSGRLRWFAACGVTTGLGYLTRPEGGIVLAAAGLALLVVQWRAAWRRPWLRLVRQGVCLTLPALLVGAFYFVPVGKFTAKPSINKLVAAATRAPDAPAHPAVALRAQLWADSFVDVSSSRQRLLRGVWTFLIEVGYSLHYIGLVPLLVGLFGQGRVLHRQPAAAILTLYFWLHASALLLLATSAGYLSDRHLMPLIMLLCYLVMVGLLQLGDWIVRWHVVASLRLAPATVAMVLLMIEIGCGLPQTLKKLHVNRAGNHAAGLWLAQRLEPGDLVLDDHDWSHYYAGQVFLEHHEPAVAAACRPTCYVVITRSHDPKVAKIRDRWERRLQFSKGKIVHHWPASKSAEEARIVIYALPRDPKTHPWRVAEN